MTKDATSPPTAPRATGDAEISQAPARERGERASPRPAAPPPRNGGNGNGHGPGDGGPDFRGGREGLPAPLAKVGLGVMLGSMAILFSALVSAYVVRMGLGGWESIAVGSFPSLWVSTFLLVLASAALVRAGRRSRRGMAEGARRDLLVALGLGAAFLVSQASGWLALRDAGLFVATNPASSFIYLLTGLHGVHIAGGLAALVWVLARRLSGYGVQPSSGMAGATAGGTVGAGTLGGSGDRSTDSPATPPVAVEACGLYWHFLLAVWLVFFALMLVT